jgi:hypothetical protein
MTMQSRQKIWIWLRSSVPGIVLVLTLITVAGLGEALAANTFYIAANGSDGNNGASKTTPWLHAPGMPACSGTCASYTPQPGDSFIFRGGDTWHFGNSSASPYTGGLWTWKWNGISQNCVYEGSQTGCIYVGVDQSWFSGASWARPILTADNPLTPHPGVWGDTVSSCAYQIAGGAQNQMLQMGGQANIIFDNFEMTGLCQNLQANSGNGYGAGQNVYLSKGDGNIMARNFYIHGWTHIPFSCSEPQGEPVGICFSITAISEGPSTGGTVGPGVVCDGSDSDPGGAGCLISTGYRMVDSIFRYNAQGEGGNCHDIHDNIFEYWASTGDQLSHANAFECNSDYAGSTPNVFYNNTFRHVVSGIVLWWMNPNPTAPEYWFNNTLYDDPGGNYVDVDPSGGGSKGSQFLFNNTFDMQAGAAIDCRPGMTVSNNQYITEAGSQYKSSGCSIPSPSTELKMSHATSNSQGYTVTNTFNDYPDNGGPSPMQVDTCATETTPCIQTAAGNSTVGKGVSWQSYCTALAGFSSDPTDVDAANACQSDTTTACSYDATKHVVSCPARTTNTRGGAWDIGAYEYNSQQGGPPNPPTGLTAVVN